MNPRSHPRNSFRVAPLAILGLLGWFLCLAFAPMAQGAADSSAAPAGVAVAAPPAPEIAAEPARGPSGVWLTFGLDRVPALRQPLLGNPWWQYLASLIYIVLAFYVSKLVDLLLRAQLHKLVRRTSTRFDDLLVELVRGPAKVLSFVLLMHIGLEVFAWPAWVSQIFSNGLKIIVAASLTYVALKLVDLAMNYWHQRVQGRDETLLDLQLFPLLTKSLKIFVIVIAVLVTSQNIGMNITSLIASLSIGGLALGLAAQDTLGNLFGAVAIFIDKPFRIGDRVQLDGIDGTIESIGLRSTRVRHLDGYLITVPNKTMGNATITNISRRPNIKTVMDLGLTYDTPAEKVEQALAILKEIYQGHPMTHDFILSFNKFADSSLNILVVHWWKSTDAREYLGGWQQLNLEIKKRFDAARIDFAFPSRTVYLKTDGERPGNGQPGPGRPAADAGALNSTRTPGHV